MQWAPQKKSCAPCVPLSFQGTAHLPEFPSEGADERHTDWPGKLHILDVLAHCFPVDEVDGFFQRIDAVTLDQATRKYYQADHLTFVLLGNAAKIRDVAKKYGPKVIERPARQSGWTAE